MLALSSFEAANSVFTITSENNSFLITTPQFWSSRGRAETTAEIQKLLRIISKNDIDLHVEEVRKRGSKIFIRHKEYKLSDLDTHKSEILGGLKIAEFNDIKNMV